MARPLNYTTKIAAAQTVGECQQILAQAGASSVAIHYENGTPAGLSFALKTPHGIRNFTLPVDVPAMQAVLKKVSQAGGLRSDGHKSVSFESREHAERVAWRVVKDWLEANLALIAAKMATLDVVMLPYLHVSEDLTLWQRYQEREQAALEAGGTHG